MAENSLLDRIIISPVYISDRVFNKKYDKVLISKHPKKNIFSLLECCLCPPVTVSKFNYRG